MYWQPMLLWLFFPSIQSLLWPFSTAASLLLISHSTFNIQLLLWVSKNRFSVFFYFPSFSKSICVGWKFDFQINSQWNTSYWCYFYWININLHMERYDEILLIPELNVVHWLKWWRKKDWELCWTINVYIGVVYTSWINFHVINS